MLLPSESRDNTDLPACEEKSVVAMNTLDQNANAVEELVFALTLNIAGTAEHQPRRTVAR